ncbi:hypothetical protein AAVH_17937 [Aphelenchoides avenae]|nr:hypothetical protein AAVH_17937 [Aphelenchus avenae]
MGVLLDVGNECCRRHDICYGQCAGKERCDNEFRTCLDAAVDGGNPTCQGVPFIMYQAVNWGGKSAYEASCA